MLPKIIIKNEITIDQFNHISIPIHSKHQGKGYGQMLINSLKEKYEKLNGWVRYRNDICGKNLLDVVSVKNFRYYVVIPPVNCL